MKNTYNKITIRDLDLSKKRVLVRCDFNVPMKDGTITDYTRIDGALPTLKYLLEQNAAVILCSHLGKPKSYDKKYTLEPVARALEQRLGTSVKFISTPEVIDDNVKTAAKNLEFGGVMLLENTRFSAEETKNGEGFSRQLAELADIYVSDAFGSCHRAHSSTEGVAKLCEQTAIGLLIEKELQYLGNALAEPKRPLVAILGGAKVVDKLAVIDNLLNTVDTLIIGGGMAYTFLKSQGVSVGCSLVDEEKLEYCKNMMKKAEEKGVKLLLPVDTVAAKEFPEPIDNESIVTTVFSRGEMSDSDMGLDIGPKTAEMFADAIAGAGTVIWNGPMGVFENPVLAKGTLTVAQALAKSSATTIVCGGDSAAAVVSMGLGDKISHISTGGGASLEFLEGKVLPGIACIADK